MKFRTTQKAIKNNYSNVLRVGYCNLQSLLAYERPIAYTTRTEGWGCDIYEISQNTVISTGYAPFGNIKPEWDVQRKYDKMAESILYDSKKSYEEKHSELKALQIEFVKEVMNK